MSLFRPPSSVILRLVLLCSALTVLRRPGATFRLTLADLFSIPFIKDGERCAEALKSIFENAKDPDKVVVGLVEQNAPPDAFCLEEFCKAYGAPSIVKRQTIRKDMVKIQLLPDETLKCPRYNQVRKVAFHNLSAKGPLFARSLARKVLGNEEYCMQVDAHTAFVEGWDVLAKEEWKSAGNEFAVISTAPAPKAVKHEYSEGGDKFGMVPRQCKVFFKDNGFPVSSRFSIVAAVAMMLTANSSDTSLIMFVIITRFLGLRLACRRTRRRPG